MPFANKFSLNDFQIFGEDWTREYDLPAVPYPEYINPYDSGEIFRDDMNLTFEDVLRPIDPIPDEAMFGVFEARVWLTIARLRAIERNFQAMLRENFRFSELKDLTMTIEQLYVPHDSVTPQEIEELIAYCSWNNLRLRGSYTWSHLLQIHAFAGLFHPFFNKKRWGAIVDMLPFSNSTSDLDSDFVYEGYLLNAIDEGTFRYPCQFMGPRDESRLATDSAERLDIVKLWSYPQLPPLALAGIFLVWYNCNRLYWRTRHCLRVHHDCAYFRKPGRHI